MNLNNQDRIFIIIPAYKSAKWIGRVLDRIPSYICGVVVVDDCSPDDLADRVRVKMKDDPRIHLVSHVENQGVGGAMLTGYKVAFDLGAQIMIKIDSDDQMDVAYLPALIEPLKTRQADYTKGNRFIYTRHINSMPLIRRIGNIGLSMLTKFASGYWNVFDPTNGYTAITRQAYTVLDLNCIEKRFFYETSMLIELGIARAVVQDVYIPARYGDEVSTLSESKALLQFPPRLLKGFLKRISLLYFVRDFSALTLLLIAGLGLSVWGFTFGVWKWIKYASLNVPAPTGTIMLAVLPFILGIQFLLQVVSMDIQNIPKNPISLQILNPEN